MELIKLGRVLPLVILSALLAFSLSACGGGRDTAFDPTPPSSPETEQPVDTSGGEVSSNEFDVNTVNAVATLIPMMSVIALLWIWL